MKPRTIPGITDKQKVVWDVIHQFVTDQEVLPTMKEIRVRCRPMSSSIFYDRLQALIARGFVERHGRTYKPLPPPHEAIIARFCELNRTPYEALLTGSRLTMIVRCRNQIIKALKKCNYQHRDIATLLNLDRSTVSHAGNPGLIARRNEQKRGWRARQAQQVAA